MSLIKSVPSPCSDTVIKSGVNGRRTNLFQSTRWHPAPSDGISPESLCLLRSMAHMRSGTLDHMNSDNRVLQFVVSALGFCSVIKLTVSESSVVILRAEISSCLKKLAIRVAPMSKRRDCWSKRYSWLRKGRDFGSHSRPTCPQQAPHI